MNGKPKFYLLRDTAVLAFNGPDAGHFLQGQLSCDTSQLAPTRLQLAGLHTPQGRVLALLRMLQPQPEQILALLPRTLATIVREQLGRYVLRAKVQISEVTAQYQLLGLPWAEGDPVPELLADQPFAIEAQSARAVALRAEGTPLDAALLQGELLGWRRLELAAGIPDICPATSGLFVAQMLNLDLLHAISFTKGCYTGQEVIARAHYRGRVKRRLQRFVTRVAVPLAPGSGWRLPDGRRLQIIQALPSEDGRTEFLAVAPLATETSAQEEEPAPGESGLLDCTSLPLPYALP